MGPLLLIIAVVFEIAVAAYCITTKQNHTRLRGGFRVAALTAFVILILTSVIIWSFRWVLLGILLLILALSSAIALIRHNKSAAKPYKTSRIIRKAVMMTVVLVVALAPAIVFPQYKSPRVTGSYVVATSTHTYVDENRIEEFTDTGKNRYVNAAFWYPKNADGTYPLVVFSHGAYGISSSNASTYMELASHGYVVVSIDHPYHSFYTVSEDGTTAIVNSDYMREFNNSNKEGIYTPEQLYELIQKWMKLRTDDMNFVIDTILKKSTGDSNPIYQLIDTDKIGVFGHSMGGAASVWLGRERDDISAVVNIDAPLFSELDYDKEINNFVASGEPYTTPLLNIYSDDVWKQLETASAYAANKTVDEYFTEAYTVHFQGAKHLSLTDLSLYSPIIATMLLGGSASIDPYYCLETQNALILQFFNDTLKGIGIFDVEETY